MVRIKERYLLVNILYPTELGSKRGVPDLVLLNSPTTDQLTPGALIRALRAEIAINFGDYGSGAIEGGSLSIKYLSPSTSTFILKINRPYYRLVWTALTMMNAVPVRDGKPCVFRVTHVSGTIRRAEEEAIRRARALCIAVQEGHDRKLQDPLGNIFGQAGRPMRRAKQVVSAETSVYDTSDVDMGEASEG
ncbi:Rpp14 family protein [Microdochium trichocladiopsis]|uniref:Rpp14 family protein n=1 Tax=Microdochium trichocladiopsis TaxID=1682393 RepID=A0A9P8Y6J1_9PEZI|nr:Rpp14 family protein [Microdochium trichocladiopsis]KAH7031241.1 Rpp14 family protein [Microdochium trichocladiopsis]